MKMNKLLALYPQAQKKTVQRQKLISFLLQLMMLLFGLKAIHYPNKKLVF